MQLAWSRLEASTQLHGDNRRRGQKRQERAAPLLTPDAGAGFRVGRRAVREPPLREENVIVYGIHPHPNLPPSRGKGLLGAGKYRIWRRQRGRFANRPYQRTDGVSPAVGREPGRGFGGGRRSDPGYLQRPAPEARRRNALRPGASSGGRWEPRRDSRLWGW